MTSKLTPIFQFMAIVLLIGCVVCAVAIIFDLDTLAYIVGIMDAVFAVILLAKIKKLDI